MTSEEKDPRIVAAAAHWSHRMITNGVPLADFQDVTAEIRHWDEWCSAWVAKGNVHRSLGESAADEGRMLTAGGHFSTAAVCYHFGKFLFVHDRRQMREAHEMAVDAHRLALPYIDPPGERLEIPFEGSILAGNLRKPRGANRPPVVIMCMGLDSTKEEMLSNEKVFLDRGLATFAFDGPGQGEAEYDLPIRFDYEVPVGAVIDFLQHRKDINAGRIGLWGVSLGGYYAPRAAAFESRIRACVSLTGPFDFAEAFGRAPDLTRAAFTARSHSSDETEAHRSAGQMSLASVAGRITCPIYIVGGALDRVIPQDHPRRLAEAVSGDATLNMVEDGTHVANNRPYKYRPQSADWMAGQLTAERET